MKNTAIVLVGLCSVLAACSSESHTGAHAEEGEAAAHSGHHATKLSDKAVKDKAEAAKLLVERFDAEECAEADLLGSVKRTDPEEGESIMRGYQVSVACANKALAAVKGLGYEESEADTFTGTSSEGAAEKVKIQIIGDGASATVEWEAQQK